MIYNFPATKYSATNTVSEQVAHLLSEAKELRAARDFEGLSRVFEETLDVLHSAETLVRVFARVFGEKYVEDGIRDVIEKNALRGYYLEEKSPAC